MTMVCFRTSGTAYCLPVEEIRAVRETSGMVMLPDPQRDVAGLLPGHPPLTVLSTLGAQGSHVLVLDVAGKSFGLLVDEVTGLQRVDDDDIRHTPDGQAHALVSGTVQTADRLMLIVDTGTLAARL